MRFKIQNIVFMAGACLLAALCIVGFPDVLGADSARPSASSGQVAQGGEELSRPTTRPPAAETRQNRLTEEQRARLLPASTPDSVFHYPGLNLQQIDDVWYRPASGNGGQPRGTLVCGFDNGSPFDGFNDPASQLSPPGADISFIAAAADDFIFTDPTPGAAPQCRITLVRAAFVFFADSIPPDDPNPTPMDNWLAIDVTVYAHRTTGGGGPDGFPNENGTHTGNIVATQRVLATALTQEPAGECIPKWIVDIPTDLVVDKNVTLWLSLVPVQPYPPQTGWCISSINANARPAQAGFPAIGQPFWSPIFGNAFPEECPDNPAAGTLRNLAFTLVGEEVINDCNGNGVDDAADIAGPTSEDCNINFVPDECDITGGTSDDCGPNGVPDECDPDCNNNNIPDNCEIFVDCNTNDVPDSCEPDGDLDTVINVCDNCPNVANTNQADGDGDGLGNVCDNCPAVSNTNQADGDADGVGDVCDNCPAVANANQADGDGDGRGDVCDNCPAVSNSNQTDGDGDGRGDVCDNCPAVSNSNQADGDADGVGDLCDNCPLIANTNQADGDVDGRGDVCDNCPSVSNSNQADGEGDGVGDLCDNCPLVANTNQTNTDTDAFGDVCDNCPLIANPTQTNTDSDTFGDACDNCPLIANPTQTNTDTDVFGDACDNCPLISNPTQINTDTDTFGDACDNCPLITNTDQADGDADGVGTLCDNCPLAPNTNQADPDSDGLGSVCDNCPLAANPTQDDCDDDGLGDACEIFVDCNANGVLDKCDIVAGTSQDLVPGGGDGVPDECQVDCNGNGVLDEDDIAGPTSEDCNGNDVPDECDIGNTSQDCNSNAVLDECDIAGPTSVDVIPPAGDGIPDECQADCNNNGIPDFQDLAQGTSLDCNNDDSPDDCQLDDNDCNSNVVPDECDIAGVTSVDVIGPTDAIPDDCQADCNANLIPDNVEIDGGTSDDCNNDDIPDECQLANDCNSNGRPDACDIVGNDCNANGQPDDCDIAAGAADCNNNGVPDSCEIATGDCNGNGKLDDCEVQLIGVNFIQIADTNTPMPGTTGNFNLFYPRPAFDRRLGSPVGDVVFRAQRSIPSVVQGVFTGIGGTLAAVATTNTPIPGGTGNFTPRDASNPAFEGVSISNLQVAFVGFGAGGQTGVYAFSGGSLIKIADQNTRMPGTTSNFTSFDNFVSISNGKVAYHGVVTNAVLEGIFVDTVPPSPTGPTMIADTSTRIPGRSTNFAVFQPPQLDDNNISFIAESGSLVVKDIGGGLQIVAETNQTTIPDGTGNFTQLGPPVTPISGNDLLIPGFGNGGQVGVYTDAFGLVRIANENTLIPGGTSNFNLFQDMSIDEGTAVFVGGSTIVPQRLGIYTNLGEIMARVVDQTQQINGRTLLPVGSLSIGPESFDDLQVALLARFFGSSGIFVADFITGPIPTGTPGDLNGDGLVNNSDLAELLSIILNPDSATDVQLCGGDVNRDGLINGDDIQPFICLLLGAACP